MIFEEKTTSSREIYQGKIIRVRVDQVEMPEGKLATREIVEHPGGVGVVALTPENEIILVKQFRKAIDMAIYEIPAGKMDPGEEPERCGIRELEEETGLKAGKFTYLGFMYPSPGFTDEVTHVYLATELYQGTMHPDPDEYLDLERMSLKQAVERIMCNEICDGKTVFGVLKTLELLRNNGS